MLQIQYDTHGLVPVIAQDYATKDVLMLAYANKEAIELTQTTGYAHYYSRSRKKLWKKGEESGHMQKVHEILVDCDEDAIIYLVDQTTAACHTGYRSCFYRRLDGTICGEQCFDPDTVYTKK